jgi:hypothetical protein
MYGETDSAYAVMQSRVRVFKFYEPELQPPGMPWGRCQVA